jgi:tetratricopeptide (TPR) repeat protein
MKIGLPCSLEVRISRSRRGRAVRALARLLAALAAAFAPPAARAGQPADAGSLRPEPAPPGFHQILLPAFDIQTDVSKSYCDKLARKVTEAEQRMYQLFNFSVGFLKGNDRTAKLGKYNIPGDTLSRWGFKPWIEIRVYRKYEDYADECFNETDRLESLVNNTPLRKETPEQRALRRLTEGVPQAYYMRISDYDGKYRMRRIRAYLGPKSPEEVESDILHELGHVFLETYLFELSGAARKGHEDEKRGTPAWIAEGIAQLFEINWSSSKQCRKLRLRNAGMVYEAVKAGDAYPFDKFISVTNAHNLMAVASDRLKALLNYVQSYSVMMFMVEKDWPRYLNFLEALRANHLAAQRRNPARVSELFSIQDDSFRSAFGIPLLELEKYWTKYVVEAMEKELKSKPEGYYWCGEYYLMRREPDKAEERFKRAVAGAPGCGEGYLGLGRVALLKNDIPAALEQLGKAAQLMPNEEEAHFYLGQAQRRAGKLNEAIASFEKAVQLYPHYHEALAELGQACIGAREFKRAMETYDKAFQIQCYNPYYLMAKGQAAFFARDYAEAQRDFAVFTQVLPKRSEGHMWYGLAAWRLDQKEFATQKLEEAVKLDGRNQLAREALAMARQGQTIRLALEAGEEEVQEDAQEEETKPPEAPPTPPAKKGDKDEE